jgi:hypothetical protein
MLVFVTYPGGVDPLLIGVFRLALPEKVIDAMLAGRLVTFQLIYSLVGLALGLACVILGVVLLLHGIAGSTGWVVQLLGLRSSLSDAAPGTILFVVGLVVVFLTRFDVRTGPTRRRR